jgi:hypothetical protein
MTFNGSGTEFRYTPDSPLTPGSTYTLYITNRAKDLSNNGINDPDSDGTVALARLTVSETAEDLALLSTNPQDGDGIDSGTDPISVFQDFTISFNRPVDFVSFKANATITPAVSVRMVPSGDGISMFHTAPLTSDSTYTLTIGPGVKDLAGNTLNTTKTITFKTDGGLDLDSISYDTAGGTVDDVTAIVTNLSKVELAVDNQDLVTFAGYFAPTFTMSEQDCSGQNMGGGAGSTSASGGSGPGMKKALAETGPAPTGSGPMPGGGPGGPGGCQTIKTNLDDFLDNMKRDFVEQRNMSKGFGQPERLLLTKGGAKMSVEHFNSAFDSTRTPTGTDLYVGYPNPIPGVDYIDAQIEVPNQWDPSTTHTEFVKYLLDPTMVTTGTNGQPVSNACRDQAEGDTAGDNEVVVTYHRWNPQTMRDEEVTQICQVLDGDADSTNAWSSDNEIYPSDFSGSKNVWEDNDQDGLYNEDGLIALRDTNSNGIADTAYHLYTTDEPSSNPWPTRTPHEDSITLSQYTVAGAMAYAASHNWDIEGVDNDGDSTVFYFNPDDHSQGGDINRRVNEDWPDGADNDGDGLVDEDNDGMRNDPWPQDGDAITTNDPMPWNDWNLDNKDSVTSSDELYMQTFLVTDSSLAPSGATEWHDDVGNVYYEIPGPKGWPYTYAVGADGKPWSGDELNQYSDSSDRRSGHTFSQGNLTATGKFFFNNEDSTSQGISSDGQNIWADLSDATQDNTGRYRFGTSSDSRYKKGIYSWDENGNLKNANGEVINWQFMSPKMDSIDYNADGDWNAVTHASTGLQRVPHDRTTGGVMSDTAYLALGYNTWMVNYDYQLITDSTAAWDVDPDWARMEGDDDGDGQFNEDGLYSDYFDSDGSLKSCDPTDTSTLPCMTMDDTTGYLTLHKADGTTLDNDPSTTSVGAFDISDGIDNNGNGEVDEVEAFDDDGDGSSDEDPIGDPNDLNHNGNTTEPYDDDGDGRTDEDPVNYEHDRINDHTQWSKVYQDTTDAVVETFYLSSKTSLNVTDVAIDGTGSKATVIVNMTDTEKWTPHNPWGDDSNGDGVPDDQNVKMETNIFNLEKFGNKWLMTSIIPVNSMDDAQQAFNDPTQQFGGNVERIAMISPAGSPESGPATNVGTAPTFEWDASAVTSSIGSYIIHIEEISEEMMTQGGKPTSTQILIIDPLFAPMDSTTGVSAFTLGADGQADATNDFLSTFGSDVPFTEALASLVDGGAYSWGIIAFSEDPETLASELANGTKPEPIGDSFEPMMFATGDLPAYIATSDFGSGGPNSGTVSKGQATMKVKVGGKIYHAIPSNIAPKFYGR